MSRMANITREELIKDKRFYIDDRNINRLLNDHSVKEYRVKYIKVGMILRKISNCNSIVPLCQTYVYKYLEGGEEGKKAYEEFRKICNYSPLRSEEIYNKLIKQIDDSDYDLKKGAIVVDQYNLILDGMHRSSILLRKYGANHRIQVVQFYNAYTIRPVFLLTRIKTIIANIKAWIYCQNRKYYEN